MFVLFNNRPCLCLVICVPFRKRKLVCVIILFGLPASVLTILLSSNIPQFEIQNEAGTTFIADSICNIPNPSTCSGPACSASRSNSCNMATVTLASPKIMCLRMECMFLYSDCNVDAFTFTYSAAPSPPPPPPSPPPSSVALLSTPAGKCGKGESLAIPAGGASTCCSPNAIATYAFEVNGGIHDDNIKVCSENISPLQPVRLDS